jgi:hypothetical protein
VEFAFDGAGELGAEVVTSRAGLAGAVLGLGEQVGGDVTGIGGVVGQDGDLAGAGDGVEGDLAVDEFLGGGDVGVAGADDLLDAGDGAGAVGERADGHDAADREHAIDARELGGAEHDVRGPRGQQDHLAHAGDLGRDRGHQHRGRVRCGAAGRVDGDAGERAGAAGQLDRLAVQAGVADALGLVEGADVGGGEREGLTQFGGGRGRRPRSSARASARTRGDRGPRGARSGR